ncbi:hypothetical protein WN944_015342 [Citrus x changshan-huyou]|uniref:Disease resistance protein Roq1-like winged-helix domain-containing protein n=1 Tax=Citrus x changshan-huyou TaxID=2935761 RepID=A0AAP0M7C6_9ROSI
MLFLAIACFYEGKFRDYVKKILKYCDFEPIIGIVSLIEKSLLTIDDFSGQRMHELLQVLKSQPTKLVFTQFFLDKLEFFARGRRHYAEPRKLLCPIFFVFVYHHIYISPEVTVLVIAQPTFPQQVVSEPTVRTWGDTESSVNKGDKSLRILVFNWDRVPVQSTGNFPGAFIHAK